jgi:uncharacterized damage-inducible protein DinB
MPVCISITELLEYIDWERAKWLDLMRRHAPAALEISAGPHGDGRFEKTGELIRHIFSAELRYVERLSGLPLTDTAAMPSNDVEALFLFGQKTRSALRTLLETFPEADWDMPRQFKILDYSLSATPRKIITHILLHEIRHWAQIGTLLRLNGLTDGFHDFLFSPVMGDPNPAG